MSLPLHAEADAEANRATEWYADRNPNVAVRFNEALTTAIDAIAADPKRYPVAEDAPDGWEVRNYLLVPDFPIDLYTWLPNHELSSSRSLTQVVRPVIGPSEFLTIDTEAS
ncbi:MAG: type II toxin-antitoxin system RelE/ParE family toxin [Planctomycetes bacterium]|nr:type II toxin-antitoxin system RelE/ParE family toxin [Planctomycetota bacterium]